MKRRIFWSVFFTVFFKLPIYESIAAIFWQSASYVIKFKPPEINPILKSKFGRDNLFGCDSFNLSSTGR